LTGAVGFNADQSGTRFGNGVVLPDGSTRAGVNSGAGLAPATVPSRLRFDINDLGVVLTRELSFGPNGYSEPGRTGTAFSYAARGAIATLAVQPDIGLHGPSEYHTLVFTSATGGKLFRNAPGVGTTGGVFLIGTFTVVE
jgi:hypothetical protein